MSNLNNIVNNKIISYLDDSSKHISEYKFILALSGGVDSMVLFKCLNDLRLNFYTVYFNHNHHAESENISIFLDGLMNTTNVKKHFNISLDLTGAKNFESEARNKRYFHLENLRRRLNCNFILTAHHLDDQIETLHMRKIQHAHWSNSIGIYEKLNYVRRPLLAIAKNEIINFAYSEQINWKEDPTNNDNSFLRNRIRNIELPQIKAKMPTYGSDLLVQKAIDVQKLDEIVQKIKTTDFKCKKLPYGISLDFDKFSSFAEVGKKIVLQYFIKYYFKKTSLRHSWSEWKNLFTYLNSKFKRNSLFKFSENISFYRSFTKVFIVRHDELACTERFLEDECEWYGGRVISSGKTKFMAYMDKFGASLPQGRRYKVRQWKTSDSYISATSGHRRKVSDLFIDNKLDYIQKRIQPIITDENDTILWIPGLAHSSIDLDCNFIKYSWETSI